MKKILLLLCLGWLHAHGQTTWLTVTGNPEDMRVNTIEVDPVPVQTSGDHRTMRVRVSRSTQRSSWEGVPYRSYESTVLIDCGKNTARYLWIRFYLQPLWKGESHNTTDYDKGSPRWMEFRQVEPNPVARIMRAACRSN